MKLKVFTQPACPKCPAAHALVGKLKSQNTKLQIEEYDVSTADGLAEASFYELQATPSLVLIGEKGEEVAVWRGEAPTLEELSVKMA